MIVGINATSGSISYGTVSGSEQVMRVSDQTGTLEQLPTLVMDVLGNRRPTRLGIILGPGSYTGIRLSVTLIKMIAAVYSIPILGESLFDAYARTMSQTLNDLVLVTSNARKNHVNAQLFQVHHHHWASISSILQLSYDQMTRYFSQFTQPICWHHIGDAPSQSIEHSSIIHSASVSLSLSHWLSIMNASDDVHIKKIQPIYSSTL